MSKQNQTLLLAAVIGLAIGVGLGWAAGNHSTARTYQGILKAYDTPCPEGNIISLNGNGTFIQTFNTIPSEQCVINVFGVGKNATVVVNATVRLRP